MLTPVSNVENELLYVCQLLMNVKKISCAYNKLHVFAWKRKIISIYLIRKPFEVSLKKKKICVYFQIYFGENAKNIDIKRQRLSEIVMGFLAVLKQCFAMYFTFQNYIYFVFKIFVFKCQYYCV